MVPCDLALSGYKTDCICGTQIGLHTQFPWWTRQQRAQFALAILQHAEYMHRGLSIECLYLLLLEVMLRLFSCCEDVVWDRVGLPASFRVAQPQPNNL